MPAVPAIVLETEKSRPYGSFPLPSPCILPQLLPIFVHPFHALPLPSLHHSHLCPPSPLPSLHRSHSPFLTLSHPFSPFLKSSHPVSLSFTLSQLFSHFHPPSLQVPAEGAAWFRPGATQTCPLSSSTTALTQAAFIGEGAPGASGAERSKEGGQGAQAGAEGPEVHLSVEQENRMVVQQSWQVGGRLQSCAVGSMLDCAYQSRNGR